VITYGALAAWCGRPGHARFAGYALHNTPPGMEIPWHRVINARGKISLPGRAGDTQRRLLEAEGIRIVDGRVDLARYGWKPGRKGR
jgi:methylated-DNA-protein-cysteine methyltransferase-like protein